MIKGLRKIIDGNVFQGIILFVIVFNSVIMGIETIRDLPAGAVSALATINMVCLIIFIVEIIVKLLAYGLDYFKDPWNWFDVIIVGVSMDTNHIRITSGFACSMMPEMTIGIARSIAVTVRRSRRPCRRRC